MGVRLAPSSVEQFLSIDESYSPGGTAFGRAPEEIKYVDISISNTESVFTREGNFLQPRSFFIPVAYGNDQMCVGHESHGDPDCHLNLLVQELVGVSGIRSYSDVNPQGHAVLVLLGVVHPSTLMQLIEREDPGLICCLFLQDKDWLPWLCSNEIETLQQFMDGGTLFLEL